ncbi:MAG: phage tail protein I [Rikenellaceae bacterium]
MSEYSLLPDNRSPLERGLELAFTQLLYESENPYPALLNPRQTKKPMLPYLAQDRGVPEWDSAAPESEQRQTVANAWPVRRLAGTRKGLMLAMDSLEYDAEVTPWYQMAPRGQPYHFELVAWKRQNAPINQDVVHRMIAHIEDAKSERDSYELILAFGVETGLALSSVPDRGITIFDESYEGDIAGSPTVAANFHAAGACYQAVATEDTASGVLPNITACGGTVFTGGAYRMYLFTDFAPGATT